MNNIKITKDGFVWLLVNESAKELFSSGSLSIYRLHEDDSESLIQSYDDINSALECGENIGVEVTFIKNLNEKHKGGCDE